MENTHTRVCVSRLIPHVNRYVSKPKGGFLPYLQSHLLNCYKALRLHNPLAVLTYGAVLPLNPTLKLTRRSEGLCRCIEPMGESSDPFVFAQGYVQTNRQYELL